MLRCPGNAMGMWRRAGGVIVGGLAVALSAAGPAAWAQEAEGGVAVRELGRVDVLAISTLSDQENALPRTLWRGVGAGQARRLLQLAPTDASAYGVAALVSDVLQSGGDAPEGGADRRELGLARLTALFEAGHSEPVARILSDAAGVLDDPAYAELATRARFLSGDATAACRLVERTRAPEDMTFWARARATCFALSDELPAAQLTLTVARERGADGVDAAFDAWVARATGLNVAASEAPRDTLELVLALRAGGPLNADAALGLPPPGLANLAGNARAPMAARLAAGERAAALGLIASTTLGAVYAAAPAPANRTSMDGLLAAAGEERGALARALAHQAVQAAGSPEQQARAVAAALDLTDDAPGFLATARLYADVIAGLPFSREVLIHAPVLAEAAAAADRPDVARALLQAQASPPGAPTALVDAVSEDAAPALEPQERAALEVLVVAADGAASGQALLEAALRRQETALVSDAERAAAARDAMLLLALGAANTAELRAAAEAAAADAPALSGEARGALAAMEAAFDADAVAEVALQAARALDAAGLDHPVATARVIRALWRAGLDEAARRVAVEAVLTARRGAWALPAAEAEDRG